MFDDVIDAAAARAALEAGAQVVDVGGLAGGDNFHIALLGVAHPSAQVEFAGLALHKPAEADALYAALNQKVNDHGQWPVLQMGASGRNFQSCRATLEITMVFVLDNYDSFTYNLVQYLGELGAEVVVRRNDEVTPEEVEAMRPERILLSPGPCTPGEAGILVPLIRHMAASPRRIPILGVCLGHQAIGEAFGGKVIRAPEIMHGKTSQIAHDGKTVFSGLPNPFPATRYHSLIVERTRLPDCLEISATSPDGLIMGLRHKQMKVEGVQFHPESVLTGAGKELLANFLRL